MPIKLAAKRFSWDDQHSFANLSGDVNPMHMDPVAARRTSAGSPAVHGIHTLVWALDQIAKDIGERQIARIKVIWSDFVHIDELAELFVEPEAKGRLRARVCVDDQPVAVITLLFGQRISSEPEKADSNIVTVSPSAPVELEIDAIANQAGVLAAAATALEAPCQFPAASRAVGPSAVIDLLTLSRLVGMVCPGLHSIFTGLDVTLTTQTIASGIAYRVTAADSRFRYVTQSVHGAGLSGTVEAFVRYAPAAQPKSSELSRFVKPDEFRGSAALVVGGSRGLGELTAKVLAVGGARVIISYCLGRADADRVASAVRAAGGTCDVIRYDVRKGSADQLDEYAASLTHVYYFATGPILASRVKPFNSARFDEFCSFYVKGFASLCSALKPPAGRTVRVFYPSSVYVSPMERPQGLGEYAMAKAAGETLCEEISRSCLPIEVLSRRLPRMLTDQTASFLPDQPHTPSTEVILAVIREMQMAQPVKHSPHE